MKKLRVFRNWVPSKIPNCEINNKNFNIVNDDSYEYAILMNSPNVKLKPLPKENVLGLGFEPHDFCNYTNWKDTANKYCGTYIIGDPKNLGGCFKEGHSYMYYFDEPPKEHKKLHKMCIVASHKKQIKGHKLRHDLINRILKTDMDIHIYGKGINALYKDKRVKGEFKELHEVYPKYLFDITIENCIEGSWMTEKIFNPVYYGCCPIYWGNQKIKDYCNDFYYDLPLDNVDLMMSKIKTIYNNADSYYAEKKEQLTQSAINISQYNYLDFANDYFDGLITNKIL